MPENESTDSTNASVPSSHPNEKVGDILHKERVTRRITLDTISKDLKLNIKYIKAIESNSYKELPADPYIRVYLRSIANYLMLDSEEILKKFFEEKGIITHDIEKDRSTKIIIDIEREKIKAKNLKTWILLAIIIIILVLLGYLGNTKGWFNILTKSIESFQNQSSDKEKQDSLNTSTQENADSLGEESPMDTLSSDESNLLTEAAGTDDTSYSDSYGDSLRLIISVTEDSVWVQVFRDGVSWKNFIQVGESKVFYARDSLNIHVGRNSTTRYFLNGEPLEVKGRGIKMFKIDHQGVELWKLSKWRRVFKNRL